MAVGREWPTARNGRPRPQNLEKGASAITSTAHGTSMCRPTAGQGQWKGVQMDSPPHRHYSQSLGRGGGGHCAGGRVWAPTLLPQEHCSASGSRRPDHRVSLQPGVLVFPLARSSFPHTWVPPGRPRRQPPHPPGAAAHGTQQGPPWERAWRPGSCLCRPPAMAVGSAGPGQRP